MTDVSNPQPNGNSADDLIDRLTNLDAKWSSVVSAYHRGDLPRDVLVTLLKEHESKLRDLRFAIQRRIEEGGAQ